MLSGPAPGWECGEEDQVQGETESNVVITEASANLWRREGGMVLQRCPESRPAAGPLSPPYLWVIGYGLSLEGMKPWVRQLPQAEGHSWGYKEL